LSLVQGARHDLFLDPSIDPWRPGAVARLRAACRKEVELMDLAMTVDVDKRPGTGPGEARQQYGVLPWRFRGKGGIEMLLITSRERGRWIVPRGWPMEGRAPFMTAALEAFEEAGIIGDIDPQPLTDFHYLKGHDDGSREHVKVTLFGMNVQGTLTHWRERGQRKRQWFGLDEAAARLDDVELARFVRMLASDPARLVKRHRSRRGFGLQQPAPEIGLA
jgi:8-oxo-dGTP pyrophosphatase MutT (NUDIX family)